MAKVNLSIYLIKEEIKDFDDIVVENSGKLQEYDDNSIVYFSMSYVKEPDWLNIFFGISDNRLQTANSRAVFLKRINVDNEKKRIFAISFGYGKNLLKDDVCEEQFGLKIVLNTIEKNRIKRISKIDIGKNYKQSQEQMPRESDINDFGFDIDRDLIKYVTGKSEDEKFGKSTITGGDIFNLVIDMDVNRIDDFLIYCYKKYNLETYKVNFKWLDHIKYVKDTNKIDQLNKIVVDLLNKRDFTRVWLAIPEMIDWGKVKCIDISRQKKDVKEYMDIDNNVFIDSFKNSTIQNFDQIKNKQIFARSSDDNSIIAKWSASKCIVGSIEHDNKVYAINGGNWYEVNNDFVEETNKYYDSIPLSKMEFIDCQKNITEDVYNNELVKSIPGSHLIHKYKIPTSGGSGNNIEPCDVAVRKTLIHIKKNGGSSYLSHLFNQAANSCSALKDNNFRARFKQELVNNGITDLFNDSFNASEYTIILAIINDNCEDQ